MKWGRRNSVRLPRINVKLITVRASWGLGEAGLPMDYTQGSLPHGGQYVGRRLPAHANGAFTMPENAARSAAPVEDFFSGCRYAL